MSDRALIERFRSGDADAVRTLYERYGGGVYSVALRALGDRSLAEEATQATFLKAWRSADRAEPDRDPAPWLYTIARRTAIDLWRRESRRPTSSYDELDAEGGHGGALVSLPPSLEQAWSAFEVRQAVDGLDADERAVVRLQHFDGMSHSEIAEKLGVPIGTVKSRSHRAHRRLAARLGHLAEEDS
ncbi:MAG: sigma-70 family RNA polymerase sigma factor [Acidimicrobiia bacterium]|nr:sigma-70 family RNA polymerase sigma factor [Acidimicrobiia bacterium]